jgi:circadian clock protein KaiC
MEQRQRTPEPPAFQRIVTAIPGLDAVLGGGLPARRTCLIAGDPGTGKTTLGNQLAFAHAASGGQAIFATLLTETHDTMLANLRGFGFFDPELAGTRVTYLSLLNALEQGFDAVLNAIRQMVRERNATLLVIDGTAIIGDVLTSTLDLRRFAQQLQIQSAMLGCTTVLLTGHSSDEIRLLGAHFDGIVTLANEPIDSRHVRMLQIMKLRGARHIPGAHEFSITDAGIAVHPRLESIVGRNRPAEDPRAVLGTGVAGLDAMLGGGFMPYSSTLVIGTPGAGKTLLGLSFLTEGAERGEPGLIAGFHEPPADLVQTAAGIGLNLGANIENGLIRVMWDSPIELSVDDWAWRLLDLIEQHKPTRVFIDAITDVQRLIAVPQRLPAFVTALINELRARATTALIATEIDSYVDERLAVPVPAASATMDNGILLRQVEVNSSLRRLVSVLKARQSATDPMIREFVIGNQGIDVSRPFSATSGLLTGRGSIAESNSSEPGQ